MMGRAEKKYGGFAIKYSNYRDRCYDYIRDYGPATAHELYTSVRNVDGSMPKISPCSPISLTTVLKRDPRFHSNETVRVFSYTGEGKVTRKVWDIVNTETFISNSQVAESLSGEALATSDRTKEDE
tara:strand:- start:9867 stop:10244 length:378 start_codon:yes stop_codon:yes gene_type:complete